MEEKIEQQKQLIIKAKFTIDKLRADLADKNQQLLEEKQRNDQLEQIVNRYLQDEKQLSCERVLAKVKVEEIEWLCIKNAGIEWVRESEFNQILDPQLHKDIQQLDYTKNKDDVLMIAQQYDQRMKILQQECFQNENQLKELKQKYAELQNDFDKYKQEIVNSVNDAINQSEKIREASLTQMDETMDCEAQIKLLLLQFQKVQYYRQQFCNPALHQLKQHLIMLNQTIYELIQNQQEQTNIREQIEREHKSRLQEIEEERQMEREQKIQHFENGRQQIQQLENTIEQLSKEIREKNQKIDIYNQENKKNANIQYIKNVIIRFFTEEYSVKQKTIPVIATVLQFTEAEQQTVQLAWEKESKSFLGRIFK